MSGFIDFKELKATVTIHQGLQYLGLQLQQHGGQLRGPCPACKSGGMLVITPAKGLYFCSVQRAGGDVIALVAHVKGVSVHDAAKLLTKEYGTGNSTGTSNSTVSKERASQAPAQVIQLKPMAPLDYLLAEHESVQALGITPAVCQEFGAGYAPKGVLRGRFALPIHNKDGQLLAYAGIAVSAEQSPRLLFHNFDPHSAIFNQNRVQAGDLYLARDPVDVLKAFEAGVENVVAFLTPITPQQVEMLAALMDEKKIETLELF